MAGLEQLEIHRKSYIVRWVHVDAGHSISWSVQPHKKSINFGIFKHPGTQGSSTVAAIPGVEDMSTTTTTTMQLELGNDRSRRLLNGAGTGTGSKNDASTALEQLRAKGFLLVQWYGKCDADKVSMGTYAVPSGQGGMYGMIFDNTFSKQLSKTATFVLLTYPTDAPPHPRHHQAHVPAFLSANGISVSSKPNSRTVPTPGDSVESLQSHLGNGSKGGSVLGRGDDNENATYHVGVLSKRRRKKGQGYARRFFSLDFASCTLSYYYDRNSSALRGAIPLSLAAIAADERRKEISIDSGAEIWHLKASNTKDFDEWTKALERASNDARRIHPQSAPSLQRQRNRTVGLTSSISNKDEEQEWEQVEALVSRIVGTRDAIRRLSKDTAPGGSKRNTVMGMGLSTGHAPNLEEKADYFGAAASAPEKKPFWKRKSSSPSAPPTMGRVISAQLTVATPPTTTSATNTSGGVSLTPSSSRASRRHARHASQDTSMHEHCTALLSDLDAVLNDFSTLLAQSKRRRLGSGPAQRTSSDSTSSAEFFDAEPGDLDRSQVFVIDRQSEEDTPLSEAEDEIATDASSISSAEKDENLSLTGAAALFPGKPKSLDPLPVPLQITRRKMVPSTTVQPPSLISFLRKNIGKDLSTISMPVSANEPTSFLQRIAEQLEYAQLLDRAAVQKVPNYRLLQVTAFAISNFSINRCRERAIRKPFNPMLGETFELVRTENEVPGGFRFIAEKVSHRPVRMACQADSARWSFSQSPAPTNKFWGKSAEIVTEGRIRLVLRLMDGSDELYSWTIASAFLRNIVMGEKYVEPVGCMTISNETTGAKASIEFKQKGMFGGRSEDVQVETYGPDGIHTGTSLTGTWTNSLRVIEAGKGAGSEIWQVGTLVDDASQTYGLTTFAATLNEITEIEKGKLPVTDSRLRPDQRLAEAGNLNEAEAVKAQLEEKQRLRRSEMEERGETWKPRWFFKLEGGDDGEEVWKLKSGKEGYWEERSRGIWTGVENVLSPLA